MPDVDETIAASLRLVGGGGQEACVNGADRSSADDLEIRMYTRSLGELIENEAQHARLVGASRATSGEHDSARGRVGGAGFFRMQS